MQQPESLQNDSVAQISRQVVVILRRSDARCSSPAGAFFGALRDISKWQVLAAVRSATDESLDQLTR